LTSWPHFDAACRLARALVHDEDAARDIAVEACDPCHVLTQRQHVLTRARSRALDHLRRGGLTLVHGYDIERVAGGATPEQLMVARQERDNVVERIGAEGMLVLEATAEGFTDGEIAAVMGKTPEAVRQIRSRARRKLIEVE
jgi:DNA-directed RNA polymerase specialized sigma24 family protein